MPFLTFGSADLRFAEKELVWRIYTAAESLPTTMRVELFGAKEFAAAALGVDDEAFVVHVASLLGSVSQAKNVYPFRQAQIASLDVEEVPVMIPAEYLDYTDVFYPDSAAGLPEQTGINGHPINPTFQVARRRSDTVHPQEGR